MVNGLNSYIALFIIFALMHPKIICFLIYLSLGFYAYPASVRDTIDLSGIWDYRLIGAPSSISGEGSITLPSSLDEAHKSVYVPQSTNTTHLRQEFSFAGEATYSKNIEIPVHWSGKDITLIMERTKPSSIKIDGKEAGYNSRISSPQKYDLSGLISPGLHLIEIKVNNVDSIPPIVSRSSHAVSESTQTNWNGILGEFFLEAKNPFNIKNVRLKEHTGEVDFIIEFSKPASENSSIIIEMNGENRVSKNIYEGQDSIIIKLPLSAEELWSDSNPVIHKLSFIISDKNGNIIDSYKLNTGFRNFSTSGNHFTINGNPVFLRGTVNAAVFPLTAYAPLDEESWINYFYTIKNYGFNHVRFHSWTPPSAAFKAADEAGIFILTELPIWGELDRDLKFHNTFLKEELNGVMESYSHHPSFVMFSTGNELWGDISLMSEYMNEAKRLNPRILASQGSNVYLGMKGKIGGEDFIVSAKTGDNIEKSIRGSVSFADSSSGGHFNSNYPNSNFNFNEATQDIDIPVISHEVGQYQSYPDFSEIEKYTGILKPDNLLEFRKRAEEAGTYRKNKEFTDASGEWATKLYKAEMELAQRSSGLGGFQLFGLQDYPGQGTALVGILDPFMEPKGFISPDEWKKSNSDLLLLAELPKFTFIESETVEIPVLTINYTANPDTIKYINWDTGFAKGTIPTYPGIGLIDNGEIRFTVPEISSPQKVELSFKSDNGVVTNSYDLWIYPKETTFIKNITVTDNLQEALDLLQRGEKVILCPDSATVSKASLDPLFINDFWNYRMFRSICDEMHLTPSPGTLGLLINENHPSLKKFPTGHHTDWQWYPIVVNSRPLIIDRLPKDIDPIVEVIDNVERNFRLALMLECNVGKGKLVILSADMEKATQYPEGKWLLQSIMEYMASKEFKPTLTLTPAQVVNLVTKPSSSRLIKELKNETYNSNWD